MVFHERVVLQESVVLKKPCSSRRERTKYTVGSADRVLRRYGFQEAVLL